ACLLMAIQQDRSGASFNADVALGAGAMKDTDGDGLKEIVDGWGNPVVFFRWPCLNAEVDQLKRGIPANMNMDRDDEDPDRRLMDAGWTASNNGTIFNTFIHPIRARTGNPPLGPSYYSKPVIVSMGKDGKLGLKMFMEIDPASAGQATDNRYSFKAMTK